MLRNSRNKALSPSSERDRRRRGSSSQTVSRKPNPKRKKSRLSSGSQSRRGSPSNRQRRSNRRKRWRKNRNDEEDEEEEEGETEDWDYEDEGEENDGEEEEGEGEGNESRTSAVADQATSTSVAPARPKTSVFAAQLASGAAQKSVSHQRQVYRHQQERRAFEQQQQFQAQMQIQRLQRMMRMKQVIAQKTMHLLIMMLERFELLCDDEASLTHDVRLAKRNAEFEAILPTYEDTVDGFTNVLLSLELVLEDHSHFAELEPFWERLRESFLEFISNRESKPVSLADKHIIEAGEVLRLDPRTFAAWRRFAGRKNHIPEPTQHPRRLRPPRPPHPPPATSSAVETISRMYHAITGSLVSLIQPLKKKRQNGFFVPEMKTDEELEGDAYDHQTFRDDRPMQHHTREFNEYSRAEQREALKDGAGLFQRSKRRSQAEVEEGIDGMRQLRPGNYRRGRREGNL